MRTFNPGNHERGEVTSRHLYVHTRKFHSDSCRHSRKRGCETAFVPSLGSVMGRRAKGQTDKNTTTEYNGHKTNILAKPFQNAKMALLTFAYFLQSTGVESDRACLDSIVARPTGRQSWLFLKSLGRACFMGIFLRTLVSEETVQAINKTFVVATLHGSGTNSVFNRLDFGVSLLCIGPSRFDGHDTTDLFGSTDRKTPEMKETRKLRKIQTSTKKKTPRRKEENVNAAVSRLLFEVGPGPGWSLTFCVAFGRGGCCCADQTREPPPVFVTTTVRYILEAQQRPCYVHAFSPRHPLTPSTS